jgi:hypothetical protein
VKRRLSLLVLVALAAAGCTTETTGSANPAPQAARTAAPHTGAPSTSRRSGKSAPQVSKPLNTASLTSDPCSVLSDRQRTQLGLGDGTAKSPGCEWAYTTDQSGHVDIAVDPNPGGLQAFYDQRGKFAYFQSTLAFGYPAVYAADKDLRTQGQCELHVALTDQQTAAVTTQITSGTGATNPCSFALKAGVDLIETLKGS